MIFEVFRHWLASIETFFDFSVSDVATYDNSTIERETSRYWIFVELFENFAHRLVEVDTNCIAFACITQSFRNVASWLVVEFFDPDTVFVDFTFNITVSRAANTHTYRARCAVARHTHDTDVVSKIFTTKLCTKTDAVSFFEDLFFEFYIAESTTEFVTCSREFVVVVSRSEFHSEKVFLSRCATDTESNVVRRTSSSAESFDFFNQERHQSRWVEERFSFLIEICFVSRTTTFSHAKEVIFHTFVSVDVDLSWEVTFSVYLIVHVERCVLRVTKVFLSVSVVNTKRESLFVAAASPNLLTFFPVDDSSTSVLTQRKLTFSCYFSITQESESHIFVVLACFRVVEDFSHLLVVIFTKKERYIAERSLRHSSKTFFFNFKDWFTLEFAYRYIIFSKQIVLSFVLSEFDERLITKFSHFYLVIS